MGAAGYERMHGGRSAWLWNSRQHGLPGKRCHRIFRARAKGCLEGPDGSRCSARGSDDCPARSTKLSKRSPATAVNETLIVRIRRGLVHRRLLPSPLKDGANLGEKVACCGVTE